MCLYTVPLWECGHYTINDPAYYTSWPDPTTCGLVSGLFSPAPHQKQQPSDDLDDIIPLPCAIDGHDKQGSAAKESGLMGDVDVLKGRMRTLLGPIWCVKNVDRVVGLERRKGVCGSCEIAAAAAGVSLSGDYGQNGVDVVDGLWEVRQRDQIMNLPELGIGVIPLSGTGRNGDLDPGGPETTYNIDNLARVGQLEALIGNTEERRRRRHHSQGGDAARDGGVGKSRSRAQQYPGKANSSSQSSKIAPRRVGSGILTGFDLNTDDPMMLLGSLDSGAYGKDRETTTTATMDPPHNISSMPSIRSGIETFTAAEHEISDDALARMLLAEIGAPPNTWDTEYSSHTMDFQAHSPPFDANDDEGIIWNASSQIPNPIPHLPQPSEITATTSAATAIETSTPTTTVPVQTAIKRPPVSTPSSFTSSTSSKRTRTSRTLRPSTKLPGPALPTGVSLPTRSRKDLLYLHHALHNIRGTTLLTSHHSQKEMEVIPQASVDRDGEEEGDANGDGGAGTGKGDGGVGDEAAEKVTQFIERMKTGNLMPRRDLITGRPLKVRRGGGDDGEGNTAAGEASTPTTAAASTLTIPHSTKPPNSNGLCSPPLPRIYLTISHSLREFTLYHPMHHSTFLQLWALTPGFSFYHSRFKTVRDDPESPITDFITARKDAGLDGMVEMVVDDQGALFLCCTVCGVAVKYPVSRKWVGTVKNHRDTVGHKKVEMELAEDGTVAGVERFLRK